MCFSFFRIWFQIKLLTTYNILEVPHLGPQSIPSENTNVKKSILWANPGFSPLNYRGGFPGIRLGFGVFICSLERLSSRLGLGLGARNLKADWVLMYTQQGRAVQALVGLTDARASTVANIVSLY